MTRFSVIIPTYNRKAYLLECLETVFAQTHTAHEVIIVDDGSTDGTVEALSAYGDQIQVIQQSNVGPGAARNRGAKEASGDYLAFLDSDDLWFPWTLATFAQFVAGHNCPSLLSGCLMDFADLIELEKIVHVQASGEVFADYLESYQMGYFVGAGMMVVAASAFSRTAGFLEDRLNAEDHDLTMQLSSSSGFVQILQPITLARRIHFSNLVGDNSKTLLGIARMVAREKAGIYPGGSDRRLARQAIVGLHVRSAVISALREGLVNEACPLYRSTFGWNLRLGRLAYLAAGPLLAMSARLKRSS